MSPIHRFDRYRYAPGIEVSASFIYRGEGVWELYITRNHVIARMRGTRQQVIARIRQALT